MTARAGRARTLLRVGALAYLAGLAGLAAAATVPLLFGWRANLIATGSMRPALPPGTVLLTGRPDLDELRVGDIVLVADPATPGRRFAHRLVGGRRDGRLVTRGDALAHPDPRPVPPAAIVGAGRLAVPLVGRPVLWARQGRWLPLTGWAVLTLGAVAVVTARPRRPVVS